MIVGNGPSLKVTPVERLAKTATFGLNRGYLLFDRLGFATTYLVAMNSLVIEQFGQEFLRVPSMKFLNWRFRDQFEGAGADDDVAFLYGGYREYFSRDLVAGIWIGATVTYAAMQLAYWMGFKQVVLIGVDHSFVSKGPPGSAIESEGSDPNHFAGQYFGKGVRWQLPDLATSEYSYRLARQAFEEDGREIVDATIGGKLDVFRKVPFDELFPA